jgi:hypothetical protein
VILQDLSHCNLERSHLLAKSLPNAKPRMLITPALDSLWPYTRMRKKHGSRAFMRAATWDSSLVARFIPATPRSRPPGFATLAMFMPSDATCSEPLPRSLVGIKPSKELLAWISRSSADKNRFVACWTAAVASPGRNTRDTIRASCWTSQILQACCYP